jgi:excisionase family DNA binding protein
MSQTTITKGDVLSAVEVGEVLKMSPRQVRAMAARGDLPGFKVGKLWRFLRGDIAHWVEDSQRGGGDTLRIGGGRC